MVGIHTRRYTMVGIYTRRYTPGYTPPMYTQGYTPPMYTPVYTTTLGTPRYTPPTMVRSVRWRVWCRRSEQCPGLSSMI